MNILLINHYAGTPDLGMEFRPYYLAAEWIKMGHKVLIVGGSFSHYRQSNPSIQKDPESKKYGEVDYLWIKTPSYQNSGWRRIYSIFIFILKLFYFRKTIFKILKPDIVIASSTYPFDIFPARYFAKKARCKLCFELHDLWPLSPIEIGGYSKKHPFIMLTQYAEDFCCKNANHVISLLGNTKDYLVSRGMDPSKYVYVPNGYSNDFLKNEPENIPKNFIELISELRVNNYFIVGYFGGHGYPNALDTLLDVAKNILSVKKIAFLFVGNGELKEELKKRAEAENIKNVYFLPGIKKEQIPGILALCDVLYAGGISSKLHQYGTSFNKIIDYMLSGKPIIFSVDDPSNLVKISGCGIWTPAESVEKNIEAVLHLSGLTAEKLEAMGLKGKQYAIENLSITNLASKFIEAIS